MISVERAFSNTHNVNLNPLRLMIGAGTCSQILTRMLYQVPEQKACIHGDGMTRTKMLGNLVQKNVWKP